MFPKVPPGSQLNIYRIIRDIALFSKSISLFSNFSDILFASRPFDEDCLADKTKLANKKIATERTIEIVYGTF